MTLSVDECVADAIFGQLSMAAEGAIQEWRKTLSRTAQHALGVRDFSELEAMFRTRGTALVAGPHTIGMTYAVETADQTRRAVFLGACFAVRTSEGTAIMIPMGDVIAIREDTP